MAQFLWETEYWEVELLSVVVEWKEYFFEYLEQWFHFIGWWWPSSDPESIVTESMMTCEYCMWWS